MARPVPKRRAPKLRIQISRQGDQCVLNTNRCTLEMSAGSLRDHNKDFVELMQKVKREVLRIKSLTIDPHFFKDVMDELRDAGLSAYNSLGNQAYKYLNDYQKKKRNLSLNITVESETYPLLWEFLYTGSAIGSVDPKLFWGYHHGITRYLIGAEELAFELDPQAHFFFCRNHKLKHSQEEMGSLRALAGKRFMTFMTLDELFDALEPTYNDLALHDRFILSLCNEHEFSFVHIASHLRRDKRVDSVLGARLELSYYEEEIKLPLRRLNALCNEFQFIQAPLVFLNACTTMTNPQHLMQGESFPRSFLKLGAGAVIATACDMPDRFAVAFAGKFYEFFFDRDNHQSPTASEALSKTRQYFIDEYNNPLGLAYGLYADSDLRIYW